jgi:hypothetical protein
MIAIVQRAPYHAYSRYFAFIDKQPMVARPVGAASLASLEWGCLGRMGTTLDIEFPIDLPERDTTVSQRLATGSDITIDTPNLLLFSF